MKILTLLCAVVLTGCSTAEYDRYAKAQTDIAVARHQAEAEKYKAMSEIAKAGDSAAKVAAVMAMAMGSNNSTTATAIQPPQTSEALQWASILVPGLTQVVGMRYNYMSQKVSSDNAAVLGVSTNNTFANMAGKIQAPGSISTTTLSGTGNLGSGTYTTTDRNDVTTPTPVVVAPPVPVIVAPPIPVIVTPPAPVVVPPVVAPPSPTTP